MKLNKDRMMGSVIGLAVGDALGQAVEFKARGSFVPVTGYRGGGVFGLNPGEWTDDTSMALAFMDAILKHGDLSSGKMDLALIMDCWVDWYKHGKYSVNGRCFDIGGRTRSSLQYWIDNRQMVKSDESALGNGALMRLAPAAIKDACFAASTGTGFFLPIVSSTQGVLTHNSTLSNQICCQHASQLFSYFIGAGRDQFAVLDTPAPDLDGGKVDDCRELACWAFLNSKSFGECVLKAVNLGGDADSVGAVAGQIAGACYGLEAIRAGGFLDGLAEVSMLLETTQEFISEVEAKFKTSPAK